MTSGINRKELREAIAAELGFVSLSELARKSEINEGTISKIVRGVIGLSDNNAHKIILAIVNQNHSKGLSYLNSATLLVEVLNYSYNHFSHYEKRENKLILDSKVEKWYCSYLESLTNSHINLESQIEIINTSLSVESFLGQILSFLKFWKMKHDFDHLDKVMHRFNRNKSIIIDSGIRPGMNQNLYNHIKDVFTEIRHIAHLCGEFELVHNMANWLIEHELSSRDMQTQIKAKVTLAWTLTSSRDKKSLYKAKEIGKDSGGYAAKGVSSSAEV